MNTDSVLRNLHVENSFKIEIVVFPLSSTESQSKLQFRLYFQVVYVSQRNILFSHWICMSLFILLMGFNWSFTMSSISHLCRRIHQGNIHMNITKFCRISKWISADYQIIINSTSHMNGIVFQQIDKNKTKLTNLLMVVLLILIC